MGKKRERSSSSSGKKSSSDGSGSASPSEDPRARAATAAAKKAKAKKAKSESERGTSLSEDRASPAKKATKRGRSDSSSSEAMAQKAKSEGFTAQPLVPASQGFAALSFSQPAMAAQVAAAKEQAERLKSELARSKDAAKFGMPTEAQQTKEVKIRTNVVKYLMTEANRQLVMQESGAEVEWLPEKERARLTGGSKQVSVAARTLSRVDLHCHWGASEDKVRKLLRRRPVTSIMCRLSPMTVNTLTLVEKQLGAKDANLSIGKDKTNNVAVNDPILSRQHCLITLDAEKGAVYIADLSTNGTFLNGIRLPSKKLGKVCLSHGDEILLKDPSSGDAEFGYICNLEEISGAKEDTGFQMRRILTQEENSMNRLR